MRQRAADYDAAARRMRALGHPARLRILARLSESGCCASQATACLGLSQPNTSQHLRALREAGLIAGRRRGTRICYRIADRSVAELLPVILKGVKRNGTSERGQ